MMTFRWLIGFWLHCGWQAHATEEPAETALSFTIGYVDHPRVPQIKPLIAEVYAELGIPITFQRFPLLRGFQLLDKGVIDADVAREKSNVSICEHIVIVKPRLFEAHFLLVCQQKIPCSKAVFDDPKAVVLTGEGYLMTLDDINIKGRTLLTENFSQTENMLRLGRVNYALFVATTEHMAALQQRYQVALV